MLCLTCWKVTLLLQVYAEAAQLHGAAYAAWVSALEITLGCVSCTHRADLLDTCTMHARARDADGVNPF